MQHLFFKRKYCFILYSLLIFMSFLAVTPAWAIKILENPDDQVPFLFYRLMNQEPPLDEWVKMTDEYKFGNEFKKTKIAEKLKGQFTEIFGETKDSDEILLLSDQYLGQYDMESKSFFFDNVGDNFYYEYRAFNEVFILRLQNFNDFHELKVSPAEAEKMVEKYGRSVLCKYQILILDAENGKFQFKNKNVINGFVKKASYFDSRNKKELAVILPTTPEPVVERQLYETKDLGWSDFDIRDLRLGFEKSQVLEWAKKENLEVFEEGPVLVAKFGQLPRPKTKEEITQEMVQKSMRRTSVTGWAPGMNKVKRTTNEYIKFVIRFDKDWKVSDITMEQNILDNKFKEIEKLLFSKFGKPIDSDGTKELCNFYWGSKTDLQAKVFPFSVLIKIEPDNVDTFINFKLKKVKNLPSQPKQQLPIEKPKLRF